MDLSTVNLNLLLALDALISERHVGRAARRLGVSQSAMSHQLRQLREIFDDPLLVREGQRMVPTPHAERLVPDLSAGLTSLQSVLRTREDFVPAEATGTFVLATYDGPVGGLRFMLADFHRQAPRADIRIVPPPVELTAALASGDVQVAVMPPFDVASGLESAPLLPTAWAVICRKGLEVQPLDLDRYCELPHAMATLTGHGRGVMDHILAERGRTRRVALRLPYFMALPAVLQHSDLIATVPAAAAEYFTQHWDLEQHPVPFPTPTMPMLLLWHRRYHADPAHVWFRSLFLDAPT